MAHWGVNHIVLQCKMFKLLVGLKASDARLDLSSWGTVDFPSMFEERTVGLRNPRGDPHEVFRDLVKFLGEAHIFFSDSLLEPARPNDPYVPCATIHELSDYRLSIGPSLRSLWRAILKGICGDEWFNPEHIGMMEGMKMFIIAAFFRVPPRCKRNRG